MPARLLAPWTISASSLCSGMAARTAVQRRSSSAVEIGLHRRSSATFLPIASPSERASCRMIRVGSRPGSGVRCRHAYRICKAPGRNIRGIQMIVDFQHHFTPRELIKEDPGDRLIVRFDENGAPSYTIHSLLYDLDEHIRMMDVAGIDAAFLTSANGMSRQPGGLAHLQRQGQAGRARLSRPLHRRRARPSARRAGGACASSTAARRSSARPAWSSPPRWTASSSTIRRWSRSGPRPSGSACSCSCIRR